MHTYQRGEGVCVYIYIRTRGEGVCGYIHTYQAVFSPEFTGRRAQILSHDHTHHLERSDCQYQIFAACVLLSTKHFSSVQSSLSSIFRAQTVFKFK